ncbi:S-type pyocin domain-containing protein [Salmonella enterica]|nr:S-type pyocin domain-containing protein [Salmonella enterica]
MSDDKTVPTEGVDRGHTMVVWPARPKWGQPGAGASIGINPDFDPTTGNGWLPEEDGYSEALPAGVPANIQAAINQVKPGHTDGGLMSADLWKLAPAAGYPWDPMVAWDPIFVYFPAQAVSDSNLSAGKLPDTIPVHTRIQDEVHDGAQFISATGSGSQPYSLPVINATSSGAYYTVGQLPGPMAPYTFSFSPTERGELRFPRAEENAGGLHSAGFTVGANTTDCIVAFPEESGLEPLYFAMVVSLPEGPLRQRQEEENQARAKADAEAKAEAEAAAKAREALFAKAGVKTPPEYTPEMVQAAEAALGAAGAMALSQVPNTMQLSVAGNGVWTAAGEAAGSLGAAIGRGIAALTASTAGPMVAAASTIFFSPPAGGGSDKVPGRDLDALFALNAQLLTGQNEKIEPGVNSVSLPVRGQLVNSNGQLAMQLLKTGEGLPAAVPVLNAVRDAATGLDRITVPAVAGAPERIILVNPALPPTAPSDTASPPPSVPVTPVHTGTEIKPVETITVTTTPAADIGGLQDFIYWRPYAAGTGVEPVYVMLSDPLDSGRFTRKQLDKRYKHAGDFGVNEPKKNSETLSKFRDAIEAHLTDKDTVEKGTYRREKGSKVYFNPKSMNVVILKANGEWLSGWKINPAAENGRIYLETGDL